MTTRIKHLLSLKGINQDQVTEILDYIQYPPPGSIQWNDRDKMTDHLILLNILIILTFDLRRFEDVTVNLLDALIAKESQLNEYDKGRLYHIKGYLDWKINNSVYQACKALNYSIRILSKEKNNTSGLYLARVHDTYGQILKSAGLLNDAREEYEISLLLREGANDPHGEAITLGNLGRLNFDLGNFEKGAVYLIRDLEIVRNQASNNMLEAQLLNTISQCYIEAGNYPEAEACLMESISINRNNGNRTGLCFNYLTAAGLNIQLNNIPKASEAISRIDEMVGQPGVSSSAMSEIEAERLRYLAEIQHRLGDMEDSLKCYRQAIDLYCNSSIFSPVEKSRLLYGFAKVLNKQGNKAGASQYYRKSLQYLDTTEALKLRAKIEKELISENLDSWILHSAGRFIGHNLIDNLLNEAGETGFRGEKKTTAVLFCDINDFTAISERFEPEDLIRFLNEFFRLMTRSVELYDGMVDKFIGDAVMAVFPARDNSREEISIAARQACMAALMMNVELERFNRKRESGTPAISISTGIHIGESVAGLIGSPQKRSFTFMGDTVNTASRLEGLAKLLGAGILISEQVYCRLAEADAFLLKPLGKYNPKGKENALVVSELMGIDDHSLHVKNVKEEISGVIKCLHLFTKREFSPAAEAFENLCKKFPDSNSLKGYEFLAAKSRSFIIDPPPENWDGEIKLFSK